MAEMSTAKLTGAEIKAIVKSADAAICQHHMYNLVESNCYSASVEILVNAMEAVNKRVAVTTMEKTVNDEAIVELNRLLKHAVHDNFSIGVSNNSIVESALEKAKDIIDKRGLDHLGSTAEKGMAIDMSS